MTASLIVALLTVFSWQICKGDQLSANWQNLKVQPETWKCLPPGDECSSATGPLNCCAGHCCSDGQCKLCGSGKDVKNGSLASLSRMEREVFTDFVGRQFRFPASEGEVYSLITEADHQVNALLQPGDGGLSQTLGITMRGVGIHGTDTSVKVSGGDDGLLAVEVNYRPFRGPKLRLDGVTITTGCSPLECGGRMDDGASVTVADRFMTLWIWAEAGPGDSFAHLSFKVSVTSRPMSQVHGILGQTLESRGSFVSAAPATRVALPANLEFYGEGQLSDYSTTDLFSSDSTFSMFTRKVERRRHWRKRSMLEGNALASLALASREAAKEEARSRLYRFQQ